MDTCADCQKCVSSVKTNISVIKKFLENYHWLTDAYISDYYTSEVWMQVDQKWWDVLSKFEPPESATLLNTNTWIVQSVWPLSLLAFRRAALSLALDRSPRNVYDGLLKNLSASNCTKHSTVPAFVDLETEERAKTSRPKAEINHGQHRWMEHCYRRHVKPKKQHEILHLSKVIHTVADHCKCSNVVDVGAGQGHLSRLLHFGHDLQVTTIEASSCHAPKARKFDEEVQRDMQKQAGTFKVKAQVIILHQKIQGASWLGMLRFVSSSVILSTFCSLFLKKLPGSCTKEKNNQCENQTEAVIVQTDNVSNPRHVVGWIDSNVTVSEFLSQIKQAQNGHNSCLLNETTSSSQLDDSRNSEPTKDIGQVMPERISNFVLTGLHGCGDLTPTMMRVFVNCSSACSLVSVGCCYHKMSMDLPEKRELGYPMSRCLRDEHLHTLSWEAREMACHSVDSYHQRLLENTSALRSHAYRAALQEIIHEKDPHLVHGSVKLTLKKTHELPFSEYVSKALPRLNLDSSVTEEQLARATRRIQHYKELVAFYSLRLVLAPVIERLILLDRICFLAEKGFSSAVVPIFDPQLSPRNFVLIAVKPYES